MTLALSLLSLLLLPPYLHLLSFFFALFLLPSLLFLQLFGPLSSFLASSLLYLCFYYIFLWHLHLPSCFITLLSSFFSLFSHLFPFFCLSSFFPLPHSFLSPEKILCTFHLSFSFLFLTPFFTHFSCLQASSPLSCFFPTVFSSAFPFFPYPFLFPFMSFPLPFPFLSSSFLLCFPCLLINFSSPFFSSVLPPRSSSFALVFFSLSPLFSHVFPFFSPSIPLPFSSLQLSFTLRTFS